MSSEHLQTQDLRVDWRYKMMRILAGFSIPWIESMATHRASRIVQDSQVAYYLKDNGLYADIGTGPGHILEQILVESTAQDKKVQMIGVEPWARPFRKVRENVHRLEQHDGHQKALFTISAGQALPLATDSMDGITCFFVVHHIPVNDWPLIFNEVQRVLKNDGVFCLVEDTPQDEKEAELVSSWDQKSNYEFFGGSEVHLSRAGWREKFESLRPQGFILEEEIHFSSDYGKKKVPHTSFVLRIQK